MHSYWNSVLHSAELDSAAQVPAAASTGKQGFGDGRTAGKPHGSEAKLYQKDSGSICYRILTLQKLVVRSADRRDRARARAPRVQPRPGMRA